MAHLEQQLFLSLAINYSERFLNNYSVLEVGSYDVNGTARSLFHENRSYVGVDLVSGPGVDVVYDGEVLKLDNCFDFVFCCEVFEHDKNWQNTFKNMVDYCSPEGVLVFTCASKGRAEHGTFRTDPTHSPGSQALGWDYYKNLREIDFESSFQLKNLFSSYFFYYEPNNCDLYFFGIRDNRQKLNESIFISEYQSQLKEIKRDIKSRRNLKARLYDAIRLLKNVDYPLRTMLLFQRSERFYQDYLLLREKALIPLSDLIRKVLLMRR